jgi:hypothetical protein
MDFKEAETKADDADARGRISTLEEQANQHADVIAIFQDKVTDFGPLADDVSALRSAAMSLTVTVS